MLTRIHVNQHSIRSNQKDGGTRPAITVIQRGKYRHGHQVSILGPSTVIYSPKKPLSCGARVWIETDAEVLLVDEGPL